jgi:sec-independent protein translocase protein TatA
MSTDYTYIVHVSTNCDIYFFNINSGGGICVFTIARMGLTFGMMNMNVTLGLFNLGGMEVLLIFVVILLLFGAKKLPELAKGLGQGIKEFKKATSEVNSEFQRAMDEQPKQVSNTQPAPMPTTPAEASATPTTETTTNPTAPKA